MTPSTPSLLRKSASKPPRRMRGPSFQPLEVAALPSALLSRRTVATLLGVSEDTVTRMVRNREFPAPVALSRSTHRWPAAWVQAWIAERAAVAGLI